MTNYNRSKTDETKADDLVNNFTVEGTMKEVSDRYVEAHDRKINELHEKIEALDEK